MNKGNPTTAMQQESVEDPIAHGGTLPSFRTTGNPMPAIGARMFRHASFGAAGDLLRNCRRNHCPGLAASPTLG
jgi:hypothetical protein